MIYVFFFVEMAEEKRKETPSDGLSRLFKTGCVELKRDASAFYEEIYLLN